MFETFYDFHNKNLCRLAKQKMLQIEFETEVSKYQGELEGIKSKNNVSKFIIILGYFWGEWSHILSHESFASFFLSWIENFNDFNFRT